MNVCSVPDAGLTAQTLHVTFAYQHRGVDVCSLSDFTTSSLPCCYPHAEHSYGTHLTPFDVILKSWYNFKMFRCMPLVSQAQELEARLC